MDHVSGTNKKMFSWTEGGGSSFPRIKKEGTRPAFPPSPTHLFPRVGKEPPGPRKQLKLSGGEACAWEPAGTAKPFHWPSAGTRAKLWHYVLEDKGKGGKTLNPALLLHPSLASNLHFSSPTPQNKPGKASGEISPPLRTRMETGWKGKSFLWAHLTCSQRNINFPLSHQALAVWPPLTDIGSSYLI